MSVDDDLTARLRAATADLKSAPIRPDRVARRARRRMALALLLAALVGVMAIVVVSAGLLAGKAAVDSTYHPPLVTPPADTHDSRTSWQTQAGRGRATTRRN
jgi:hypothetical protein